VIGAKLGKLVPALLYLLYRNYNQMESKIYPDEEHPLNDPHPTD